MPSIAKMIGLSDNVAKVAGVATDILKKVTGNDDVADGMAALQADPQLMLQFQMAMMEKEKEFEKLYAADKADARSRDIEFLKTGKRNWRADGLVIFTCMLLVTVLFLVAKVELSEFAKGVVTTVIGFVTGQLSNVFQFEFGTTRKDDESSKSILADYIKSPTK